MRPTSKVAFRRAHRLPSRWPLARTACRRCPRERSREAGGLRRHRRRQDGARRVHVAARWRGVAGATSAGSSLARAGFSTASTCRAATSWAPCSRGMSLQLEAAAQATSVDDLFARLEATQQVLRVDPTRRAHDVPRADDRRGEVEQLRRIEGVVRLGKSSAHRVGSNRPRQRDHPHEPAAPPRALRGPGAERRLPRRRSSRPGASPFSRYASGCSRSLRRSSRTSRPHATTSKSQNRLCPPAASRTSRWTGREGCSSA